MIDDQRLKALQHVTEAKQAVNEILSSEKAKAKVERLKELHDLLEGIEKDLVVTALDQSLSELHEYQQELFGIDSELDQDAPEIKAVARKVETAAQEIGIVIDAAAKVLPPLGSKEL